MSLKGTPGRETRAQRIRKQSDVAVAQVTKRVNKTLDAKLRRATASQVAKAPAKAKLVAAAANFLAKANSAPNRAANASADAKFIRSERATRVVQNRLARNFAAAQLNPIGSAPMPNPVFSVRPQAVFKVHDADTVDMSVRTDNQYLLNDWNTIDIMRRDPRRWRTSYKIIEEDSVYVWLWTGQDGNVKTTLNGDYVVAGEVQMPSGADYYSGPNIHGPHLPAGTTRSGAALPYAALFHTIPDSNGESYLKFAGLTIGTTYELTFYAYWNKQWAEMPATLMTAGDGTGIVSIPTFGATIVHLTFAFNDATDVAGNTTIRVETHHAPQGGGSTSVFGQEMAPEVLAHLGDFDSISMTAVDLLYNNRTEAVAQGGSVYGVQVNGTRDVNDFLPTSPDQRMGSILTQIEECYDGNAAKGMHNPCVANSIDNFKEIDTSSIPTGGSFGTVPPYDIDDCSDYTISALEIDNTSTFGKQEIHRICAAHLAVRSESQLYDYVAPQISQPEMERAIQIIAASEKICENPLHLGAIKNFLKKAFAFGAKAAPMIAPMFPQYGGAISLAGGIGGVISNML